ncbi:Uncharacterized protein YR821_1464 [Yersinia ruckeri]|uniref:Uncharacterized protein n=1 Tax=Yersinia ruckeri TaxID=29486 RepID=A0A0A8VCM4_YERRU|nr:hypothetical protein yruck0001_16920 [Yersinia ruckeri ATCC 29473]QTD76390.1 Uncharacterized protein YR821_1464 [Yersinia ruckeri]CEK27290.1 hypothetical protein CSF007_7670 [Yersinia ruckeri]
MVNLLPSLLARNNRIGIDKINVLPHRDLSYYPQEYLSEGCDCASPALFILP